MTVVVVHTGLSSAEAQVRLASDGPNELARAGRRSILKIVGDVVREPMLALLLGGGALYLLLGNLTEALILLAFATFSVVLTVVQETRTEYVLEALGELSAPRALVIRDGERVRIAGRDVVRGDILMLEQGDRIAADAQLLETNDLQVDESLLTGESLPVGKRVQAGDVEAGAERPGGEDQPYVYSGSLVSRGTGVACAIATGAFTEIGKIGTTLATMTPEAPRLRAETTKIVRLFALGGGAVALAVVLLYGLTRGGWIDALLAGIAIGMAMLPEEFPVVLTIFLAMGASRIGRAGVLTRHASAIETLGAATVLCTDKTGTLTENKMAVTRAWLATGEMTDIDDPAKVDAHVANMFATGQKIMGFGHRVYHTEDPRATHLREMSEATADRQGNTKWFAMSKRIEELVIAEMDRKGKQIRANVDFYSASTYYMLGIPVDLFTPIFAISRISGWTAHVMEQLQNNRLIRPRADYTGAMPSVEYVSIEKR